MNVYLAGTESDSKMLFDSGLLHGMNLLQSFYSVDDMTPKIIPVCKNFMLDSGAFSFLNGNKKKINWSEYIDKYAKFINDNNIKLFFELDIDPIIGYKSVLKLRNDLELKTGKRCIPVWHKSRGKTEFLKMCDEYDYVSIGGIVTREIPQKDYRYFPWFIDEAHKRGAKIHGLGFTNLKNLKKYHFDSVDSSSWTYGKRYGRIYKFNGGELLSEQASQMEIPMRCKDLSKASMNNFMEWRKLVDYAEIHFKCRCMKIQPA